NYAGYLEVPNWNVSLRKGQHEGLISFETFQKIQNRLSTGAKAPARKDISADFPLRGFVLCDDCCKPLTACWSKSKTGKKHPYYLCHTKTCASYRKSIRRDVLEGEFSDMLHALQPTSKLYHLARTMFKDAWTQRQTQADVLRANPEKQTAKIDEQIECLLDRIVDASNTSVIAAYEARIGKLEQEKLVITEKLDNYASPRHSFEELFELAFDFLRIPWKLWDSGQLTLKRTVLRLAFCERIAYCRKEGLRTPKMALPFKLLA
ncbi:MAG: zinc ribbon domain-containing protein, partial [Pseudomonadota bacterium]